MEDITGNNVFVMENTLLPPVLIPKKYILSRNVVNKDSAQNSAFNLSESSWDLITGE